MDGRWGHAATYIPSPPSLLIQGGKTDPSALYSYTSAPNSGDVFLLPLDAGFSSASPPYTLLTTDSSPSYSWHTASLLGGSSGQYDILSYGGDGGASEATQTQPNSAWRGVVDTAKGSMGFTHEPSGSGNQPMRRIYHSAVDDGQGKVYITGGLKADGSGTVFPDVYVYDSSTSSFSTLPALPQGLYHHNSLLLSNGTLVVMGGAAISQTTGNAAVVPLSSLYVLETASAASAWEERNLNGGDPMGRRGSSLVSSREGHSAFLFGGSDASLTEAYADGWELDLNGCSWTQVSNGQTGAGARFDHSAVAVGNDQVLIFGGYGEGGPADPSLYIWNTGTGEWTTTFSPVSNSPSGSPTGSQPTGTLDAPSESAVSATDSAAPRISGATSNTASLTDPSGSSIPSVPTETEHKDSLSTPAKIGLAVGAVAVAAALLGGLLFCHCRRKRKARLGCPARDNGSGTGRDRPYGSREKGGQGLMDGLNTQESPYGSSEKSPMVGLGMGAIGAGLASISSKFARRRIDPYAELHDPGLEPLGGPTRRSTRRSGRGIRLIGPREPSSDSRRPPGQVEARTSRRRSIADSTGDDRLDMLRDEDSRRFAAIPEEDWRVTSDDDVARWTSARSLLGDGGDDSDPFNDDYSEGEDDEDFERLLPPLRGGPVPTPQASRSDLDPFDDYRRRSSQYLSPFDDEDIDALSPPPATGGYSQTSLPRSARSGLTGSVSDAEDGVIHHAQFASQTSPSIMSPGESVYQPIKRSESFFQRMGAGGIVSLLRNASQRGTVRVLDIRDPTPAPALWPIESREESMAGPSYPPSAFKVDSNQAGHGKGPSLSSLQSARSMRDMVIVQREPTDSTTSTEEEGIIEVSSPTPLSPDGADQTDAGAAQSGGIISIGLERSMSTIYAHQRHGMTAEDSDNTISGLNPESSRAQHGDETPGSIVFNGADFATPSIPIVNFGETPFLPLATGLAAKDRKRDIATTPTEKLRPISEITPHKPTYKSDDAAENDFEQEIDLTQTTPRASASASAPSGSPVPSPLVSHRRPVRDVVNSINKRGGGLPLAFTSPASVYSPVGSPIASPRVKRPMTMYEAVKRERLLVANPDAKRGSE